MFENVYIEAHFEKTESVHNKGGKLLFKCHMSDFDCTRKEHLRNHQKAYQASSYACDHCNKKFCRKPHLKGHVCEQNSKKLHSVNCDIKNASYLFSVKIFNAVKRIT